jgi:hypothetical protein
MSIRCSFVALRCVELRMLVVLGKRANGDEVILTGSSYTPNTKQPGQASNRSSRPFSITGKLRHNCNTAITKPPDFMMCTVLQSPYCILELLQEWMSFRGNLCTASGVCLPSRILQDVSERALQLLKLIWVYSEAMYSVLNCHNVAKDTEFCLG